VTNNNVTSNIKVRFNQDRSERVAHNVWGRQLNRVGFDVRPHQAHHALHNGDRSAALNFPRTDGVYDVGAVSISAGSALASVPTVNGSFIRVRRDVAHTPRRDLRGHQNPGAGSRLFRRTWPRKSFRSFCLDSGGGGSGGLYYPSCFFGVAQRLLFGELLDLRLPFFYQRPTRGAVRVLGGESGGGEGVGGVSWGEKSASECEGERWRS
jgi:hypothetical protein